jgi:hypothetical protein
MRLAWFAHDSNWRRGPRNASAAPRACRLQRFVRPRRGAMHGARLERLATARASTEWLPALALLRRTGCSVGARRFPRAPLCTFRLGATTGPESFPSCLASLHSSPPTNRVDRRGRRGLTPTSAAHTLQTGRPRSRRFDGVAVSSKPRHTSTRRCWLRHVSRAPRRVFPKLLGQRHDDALRSADVG